MNAGRQRERERERTDEIKEGMIHGASKTFSDHVIQHVASCYKLLVASQRRHYAALAMGNRTVT